jgi:hypothetical protein
MIGVFRLFGGASSVLNSCSMGFFLSRCCRAMLPRERTASGGRAPRRARRGWRCGFGLQRFLATYLRPYIKRREIPASKRPAMMLTGLRVEDPQPSRPYVLRSQLSYRDFLNSHQNLCSIRSPEVPPKQEKQPVLYVAMHCCVDASPLRRSYRAILLLSLPCPNNLDPTMSV